MSKIQKLMDIAAKNEKRTLAILFVIAFLLRAVFVWYKYTNFGMQGWNDALYYLHLGEQMAEGNWNPEGFGGRIGMFVAPVVPLLVALFIRVFSEPILPFFVYNILMSSLMVPVLYYLGKEVFNKETGWLMALWAVFFFWSFSYSSVVLKEATLFLFLPLSLLFMIRSLKNDQWIRNVFFAALSYAWLIHTDERYLIYFPVLILFLLLKKPFRAIAFVKGSLLFAGLVMVFMIPWSAHNYNKYDQLVILTARTSSITSRLWGEDVYRTHHMRHDTIKASNRGPDRHERAIAFGATHGITPRVFEKNEARIKGFVYLWRPVLLKPTFIQDGLRPKIWDLKTNMFTLFSFGIFLPFYLIGLFVLWKQKHYPGLLLALIPVIHTVIHALILMPLLRYRMPVFFIVAMTGSYVISLIWRRMSAARTSL